ncbi:hypothetical protein [Psychromonas sp.]
MIAALVKPISAPSTNNQAKINPSIADAIELVTMWGVVATTVILLGLAWV